MSEGEGNLHMAEKFCTSCGVPLSGDSRFCTECGTSISVTEQSNNIPSVQPQAPNPAMQAAYQNNYVPGPDSKYEPISTWGYIGIMLLMSIPFIGAILVIVWALGGCRKINKRNLARASVIMSLFAIMISIIVGLLIKSAVDTFMEESGIKDALEELKGVKDQYDNLENEDRDLGDVYEDDYQVYWETNAYTQSTAENLAEQNINVEVPDNLSSLDGLEDVENMGEFMEMLEMFQGMFGQ